MKYDFFFPLSFINMILVSSNRLADDKQQRWVYSISTSINISGVSFTPSHTSFIWTIELFFINTVMKI